MAILRSALFYVGYLSSGMLASILACLIGPFIGLDKRLKLFSLWPRFTNWFLNLTCGIKVNVIGKENLPSGPCVIVSNHQGQWETFSMQYLFHPLCTLLKRELLFIPLWGWAMKMLHPIGINRDKPKQAILQTLEEGSERLKRGMFVLLFPEGTTNSGKKILNFKSSLFNLFEGNNTLRLQNFSLCYTHVNDMPIDNRTRPQISWYGDMSIVNHLLNFLKLSSIKATVVLHPVMQLVIAMQSQYLLMLIETQWVYHRLH